jgi:hypothetical protein
MFGFSLVKSGIGIRFAEREARVRLQMEIGEVDGMKWNGTLPWMDMQKMSREDERGTMEKSGLDPNTISPPSPILISSALLRYKVYEPVLVVGSEKFANIDIRLRVKGGGHVSQLYALRQAIAKGIVA